MMDHAAPHSMALPMPGIMALTSGMNTMRSSLLHWARRQERQVDARATRAAAAGDDPLLLSPAWMSPPPERRLPRDLNMPLSAFDPGAIRQHAASPPPPQSTRWTDPMALARTLDRVRALPATR